VKAPRFRLGDAMITIVFLAIYFCGVARAGGHLWLPFALVSAAVLFPAYLASLLMWRHYFGTSSKKEQDWPGKF
jgi:hypothetical protein